MELIDALRPITEGDVRDTYSGRDSPISLTRTNVFFQVGGERPDGTKVICFAAFFVSATEPLLEKELERWLCTNRRLLGEPGRRGKVAVRVKFYVRGNFQGRGFATYIVNREEELFRGWGAQEVQTPAMEAGRWVWTRSKFGYSTPEFDFGTLQQSYQDWQRSENIGSPVRASNLSDFPREFLLSSAVSTIQLFKKL
jgi:GNAT superfamily N-acetyltransferase